MKVLITGASGFIGTNLASYYLSKKYDVLNLDIEPPKLAQHYCFWKKIDVCDKKDLFEVFSDFQPDYVIHMAARTDLDGTNLNDYVSNIRGVKNVCNAIQSVNSVKYAIFASSMLVCKLGYKPLDECDYAASTIYGLSKVEGEKIVRSELGSDFKWTIVRPTSIYGPYFPSPYIDFFRAVRAGRYFHPKGRSVSRNYGFVLNLCHQINFIIEDKSFQLNNKTVYIADYIPTDLYKFSTLINSCFNKQRRVRKLPFFVFRVLALFGDMLRRAGYSNPPLTSFRLENMMTNQIVDLSPLQSLCPDLPYSVEESVEITSDWLKSSDSE